MHARLTPIRHVFRYRIFSLLIDIDRVSEAVHGSRWFGHNRGMFLSFHERDHGPRDGTPLRPWVEARLRENDVPIPGGPIRLLCFPRLYGYVFNPLAVYYCYTPQDRLAAVVHQVSNTFGQSHCYVAAISPEDVRADPIRHWTNKVFHVSPLIGMNCTYGFSLHPPDGRVAVSIRQTEKGRPLLIARVKGERTAFSDRNLRRALLADPLMTLKIIAAIHWQAFRLWLKGAKPQPEPPLPTRLSTPAESGPPPDRWLRGPS